MKIASRAARSSARYGALGVLALGLTSACSQQSQATQLRSLQASGDLSFLCLSHGPDDVVIRAEGLEFCPDYDNPDDEAPEHRRLHALVTQPETGEVALVDLYDAVPIDGEPTQPGYNFMSVGAEPGAIVSTPGGQASFVGVREAGREGIFGLPTSCIGQRPAEEPLRDITSWPACRLPAAPGPIELLLDPGLDDDANPNTPPLVRERCEADYIASEELIGRSPGATRATCPADLALESKPYGRRKLAVALPSFREVWVLDAQELLDRAPGSFEACVPEQRLVLDAGDATPPPQALPPELVPPAASCSPVGNDYGPSGEFTPYPTDFAVDDRQRLYVSDAQAPVIHVLDAANPCALEALPALHPTSYLDPGAVITTSKVAASSLTPGGKRFVYAVDASGSATAGSVIPFDVSPGVSAGRPLIKARSTWNPLEPPDRIVFPQDVADVSFVFRDVPELVDGVGSDGVSCDPDPLSSDIGAEYQPSSDRLSGAAPLKLRGTFGLAALHSGRIGVIDVEDLDAPCRRALTANTTPVEDVQGCANDPVVFNGLIAGQYVTLNGVATVSRELSCNVIEPHRVRSNSFFEAGRTGGLRSFPTLALATGRTVATDQSSEGRDLPRMLGARQPNAATSPQLIVGQFRYNQGEGLELDPNLAERSSLLLSFEEPRAYNSNEDFVAIYEGPVGASGQSFIRVEPDGFLRIDDGVNGRFCEGGVQDEQVTRDVGVGLGVSAAELDAFARRHGDYVQIVEDLPEEDDAYWTPGNPGATCGSELFDIDVSGSGSGGGRALCDDFFGPFQLQNFTRDLRIVEAGEDTMRLESRILEATSSSARRRQLSEFVSCCFPRSTRFAVRAGNQWVVQGSSSGAPHHIKADPSSGRCIQDCNPLSQKLQSRVFEISCSSGCADAAGDTLPAVGLARAGEDIACVVDDVSGGIEPGEPGAQCVFQSLTTRFAIYRGRSPSQRNMRFRWQVVGGFDPFLLNLSSLDRTSSPRSLTYVRDVDRVFLADGTARGLSFLSLRSFQLQTVF
jgi:hypothetical protein